ncbi:MAG: SagB/ThcOx family dehydrogenase, partial [Candidatus Paceibacterales bacterium]
MKSINISELLEKPMKLYEKFHLQTSLRDTAPNIPVKQWPKEWTKTYYKAYSRMEEITLPKPAISAKIPFIGTLKKRKSARDFANDALPAQDLSSLLYFSAGENLDKNKGSQKKRFYPSPGARYPLEVYVILRKSEVDSGIYHYYVKNNSLERIGDYDNMSFQKLTSQKWFNNASCLVIITA